LTSERIKDKVIQRVHKGLHSGGVPPFGYKTENGRLVLDPPRDAVVRRIFDTYMETHSIRKIVNALDADGIRSRTGKKLTDSFVWQVLRKPIYTGKVPHKGKLHPGVHPAIISEEFYNLVRKLMTEETRRPADHVPSLPFAGLIHCAECGSIMSPAWTEKATKDGRRRYHYYRCAKLNHTGWNSCTTRQIGAERFENTLYQNLLRISMDLDYLSTAVRHHREGQTTSGPGVGIEPPTPEEGLTPKNLKKSLEELLTICARRTGMERNLAIRRRIGGITYSQKTVKVEFVYGSGVEGSDSDSGRISDGKRLINQNLTAVPHSGTKSFCPPARNSESSLDPSARKIERPDQPFGRAFHPPEGVLQLETFLKSYQTIELVFPNIAHGYWDHFKRTGEFYVRPAKPPRL
jgi:hypothetical protein